MGLFTSISRAWLTIDNLIFFWNYEDGSVKTVLNFNHDKVNFASDLTLKIEILISNIIFNLKLKSAKSFET